jgi:hypothetical protein
MLAAHLEGVAGFAEVRLVDRDRNVTEVVAAGKELIGRSAKREFRVNDPRNMTAFAADLPRPTAGPPADLAAMRAAMEDAVTARIIIGGRVVGYAGRRPGILEEALLALQRNHPLFPLGGFGGAARDTAIALGLLPPKDALDHLGIRPDYEETLAQIRDYAGHYRASAERIEAWADLGLAARAEDPEEASRCVLRAMMRRAVAGRPPMDRE